MVVIFIRAPARNEYLPQALIYSLDQTVHITAETNFITILILTLLVSCERLLVLLVG